MRVAGWLGGWSVTGAGRREGQGGAGRGREGMGWGAVGSDGTSISLPPSLSFPSSLLPLLPLPRSFLSSPPPLPAESAVSFLTWTEVTTIPTLIELY